MPDLIITMVAAAYLKKDNICIQLFQAAADQGQPGLQLCNLGQSQITQHIQAS